MTERPRLFFYVQHLLGIGHLARASRIAQAFLADGFAVTLVTGGSPVDGFPGPGIDHIQLPAVLAAPGFSGLVESDGTPVSQAFKDSRARLLLAAFEQSRPDVVLIEAFPFGRRQVRFELLPLLTAIRAKPGRPLLFSSIRDILQESRKPGRDQETVDLVKTFFDGVLVHGDPDFVSIEETFPLAGEIASKVVYTGLVAPPKPVAGEDRFDIVVSAGGGAVGRALLVAAVEARKILEDRQRWCVIAGPNLPPPDYQELLNQADAGVHLCRFRPDFPNLLPTARLSISQAGYNTVCDVLRAGCQALLVPFAAGGETEQTVRAEKLEALGLARVVSEGDLDGKSVATAIASILARPAPPAVGLSLDGAADTVRIVRARLGR